MLQPHHEEPPSTAGGLFVVSGPRIASAPRPHAGWDRAVRLGVADLDPGDDTCRVRPERDSRGSAEPRCVHPAGARCRRSSVFRTSTTRRRASGGGWFDGPGRGCVMFFLLHRTAGRKARRPGVR